MTTDLMKELEGLEQHAVDVLNQASQVEHPTLASLARKNGTRSEAARSQSQSSRAASRGSTRPVMSARLFIPRQPPAAICNICADWRSAAPIMRRWSSPPKAFRHSASSSPLTPGSVPYDRFLKN